MPDDVLGLAADELIHHLQYAPVGRHLLIPGFGGFAIRSVDCRLQISWSPDVELNAMARGDKTVRFPSDDLAEEILGEWRIAGIDSELAPAVSPLPAVGKLLFDALRAGGCAELDGFGRFVVVASMAGGNIVRFTPGLRLLEVFNQRVAMNVTLTALAPVA